MDKLTGQSLEIISVLMDHDYIDMDDMSKVIDWLVDNKGVLTPDDLIKVTGEYPEVYADATGDTGWLDV